MFLLRWRSQYNVARCKTIRNTMWEHMTSSHMQYYMICDKTCNLLQCDAIEQDMIWNIDSLGALYISWFHLIVTGDDRGVKVKKTWTWSQLTCFIVQISTWCWHNFFFFLRPFRLDLETLANCLPEGKSLPPDLQIWEGLDTFCGRMRAES